MYTLGAWRGMTTYNCTRCQFDSLDEDTARQHYLAQHGLPEEALMGGFNELAELEEDVWQDYR